MTSKHVLVTMIFFLILGAALSDDIIEEDISEDDAIDYPMLDDNIEEEENTISDDEEESEEFKTMEDVPGLSSDILSAALEEAKREVSTGESMARRTVEMDQANTFQSRHYGLTFVPEAFRRQAVTLERATGILADKLG